MVSHQEDMRIIEVTTTDIVNIGANANRWTLHPYNAKEEK